MVLSEPVMNDAEAGAATATTKVEDGEEVVSSGAGSFGRAGPEGHWRRTYEQQHRRGRGCGRLRGA